MQRIWRLIVALVFLSGPMVGQGKRLWILRSPGEMAEYDPATFAAKATVKVPSEVLNSPTNLDVNSAGQMLFASSVSLPVSEEDVIKPHKVWFWNGHEASFMDQGVERKSEERGSNLAITESAPSISLSADGNHLFWFTNRARRLEREEVDLSTTITFQAWQTDLSGGGSKEVTSVKAAECRCTSGSCEETCPSGIVWVPDNGVGNFFLVTQYVAANTAPIFKSTTRYRMDTGKWVETALAAPMQRVLDADDNGDWIVEAIPDTGCCGWSNQSNDQTLAVAEGKSRVIFDERETYKNPDYDVSFSTANAKLSPALGYVAMTITATAQSNKPIQLSQEGQANPEESQRIRKALADLPAVEVKSMEDTPRRIAFVPHAALVGWISEKELLIVENHLLIGYNVDTGSRRKSTIKVDDALHVFLR